ncbi:MAG: 30S ribosomal protein S16 [Candidatus Nanopelagicales bacterium]
MAVKIKLKRIGKTRVPQYRIVIADARTARGGRAIEELGIYQPKQNPSLIRVDSERVQYWLSVGAQPTEPVMAILKVTGDWQKFKGEPGAEGTLQVAEPKVDRKAVFAAAAAEAVGEKDRLDEVKSRAAAKAAEAREAAKGDQSEASDDAAAAASDAGDAAAETSAAPESSSATEDSSAAVASAAAEESQSEQQPEAAATPASSDEAS